MYPRPEQTEEEVQKSEKRKSAIRAERLIENGFLDTRKPQNKDPPDMDTPHKQDTSSDMENDKKIKTKKNIKKSKSMERDIIESNKEILHSIQWMKEQHSRSNENILNVCMKLECAINNQNDEIKKILYQMNMTKMELEEHKIMINKQNIQLEEFNIRLNNMDKIRIKENKTIYDKIENIRLNNNTAVADCKMIDNSKEILRNKDIVAYEKFKKLKENDPSPKNEGWQENQKSTLKQTNSSRAVEKSRTKYMNSKSIIEKDIDKDMMMRIMNGKSPFTLEKTRLLYFSGFKKNRIGYIRAVLTKSGIPNEDLMSISFIGLSVLEILVKESKVEMCLEVCYDLKGSWIRNFNPLKNFIEKKETEMTEKEIIPPIERFKKRLEKIIKVGRGPIGLLKIIKNSTEETIVRFLHDEYNRDSTLDVEFCLMSEEILNNEPRL
jgi:hypothetical protein